MAVWHGFGVSYPEREHNTEDSGMNRIKKDLMAAARQQYNKIFPCGSMDRVEDGFTVEGKLLLFWFNTEDNSTHLLTQEI